MVKLSAFVCAHNEEARLRECLVRLRFADEIVVLLDRCTDGSERIARAHADKVLTGAFLLEGPRRTAALEACSGDWILEVDADEDVTQELAAEIRAFIETDTDTAWRRIPVENLVQGRLIRHGWGGTFGVDAVQRLYRRGVKSWRRGRVHPPVQLVGRGGPPLRHALRHWVDTDVSDMIARLDRYTRLRAQDLAETGGDIGLWSNAFRGVRRFWKSYVSRRGYREGAWGVLIATMAGLYPFLSAVRARIETGPYPASAEDEEAARVLEVAPPRMSA
ncbi:MAG: glycosyltransferase family 2 protein [Hyphomonadaceae bacterium]|nr:glycosyltransferase family 2 protein [Hyphomonadaceae bacterium]